MAFNPGDPLTAAQLNTLRSQQADTVSLSFAASATQTAVVPFSPAFAAAPMVVCQVRSPLGTAVKATCLVTAKSNTGFTVRVDLTAAQTLSLSVDWIATKVTSGP